MYEMTLSGMKRLFASPYGQTASFFIFGVVERGESPSYFVISKNQISREIDSLEKEFDENLILKNNPNAKISEYDFIDSPSTYFGERGL